DHGAMPIGRLTQYDRGTERKTREGAPERSARSLVGLGKPHGYWSAVLDAAGHSERLRIDVEPCDWRRRVHGVVKGDVKGAAVRWASRQVGRSITDDNEAEAICLACFAALDGMAMVGQAQLKQRVYARGKRNERRQLDLDVLNASRPLVTPSPSTPAHTCKDVERATDVRTSGRAG
ncbi:MAG TPA: hypothetical protein VK524_01385, partial [Polyangiaceae bacterium]|nr:hypothetical protein [Polyangiaceae bacterium]